MKLEELIKEVEGILTLEAGTISIDTKLNDLEEWDSLSKIALEVFLQDEFQIKVDLKTLNEFETVSDIVNLINDKLE